MYRVSFTNPFTSRNPITSVGRHVDVSRSQAFIRCRPVPHTSTSPTHPVQASRSRNFWRRHSGGLLLWRRDACRAGARGRVWLLRRRLGRRADDPSRSAAFTTAFFVSASIRTPGPRAGSDIVPRLPYLRAGSVQFRYRRTRSAGEAEFVRSPQQTAQTPAVVDLHRPLRVGGPIRLPSQPLISTSVSAHGCANQRCERFSNRHHRTSAQKGDRRTDERPAPASASRRPAGPSRTTTGGTLHREDDQTEAQQARDVFP